MQIDTFLFMLQQLRSKTRKIRKQQQRTKKIKMLQPIQTKLWFRPTTSNAYQLREASRKGGRRIAGCQRNTLAKVNTFISLSGKSYRRLFKSEWCNFVGVPVHKREFKISFVFYLNTAFPLWGWAFREAADSKLIWA